MIHTFQCNDSLVDDVLARVGRQSKSYVIREALKLYLKTIDSDGYKSCLLPNPKFFEKRLRTLSPQEVEHYKTESRRLYNISVWVSNDMKAAAKKRKELLK